MSIKKLFDDLKVVGRKRYHSRNGEEELSFEGENVTIEIFNTSLNLDLVIEYHGIRASYLKSDFLSTTSKATLQLLFDSVWPLEVKCQKLREILLDSWRKAKN